MAREDKGSATSSFQDAPSGKSGDQDSTSLAARRARLRGTLSKQIVPPESYGSEPTNGNSNDKEAAPTNGSAEGHASSATYTQAPVPVLPIETVTKEKSGGKNKNSDSIIPEGQPFPTNPIAGYTNPISTAAPNLGIGSAVASPVAASTAATAAALNGSSVASPTSVSASAPSSPSSSPATSPVSSMASTKEFRPEAFSLETLASADLKPAKVPAGSTEKVEALVPTTGNSSPPQNNAEIIEMINNLDTQIGICSVNLAQISKAAAEQLEVVRQLSDVVKNQAFGEIGLSLSSLSESMSAALEPMKAVGELVPAIDNLVVTIERGATNKDDGAKLTPDQLVMSLANQLSNQAIDPWTFKCAYMAVFPSEHPADLLKKLVDLLGAQTLSGDLFRAAYDAVQAPDPPPRQFYAPAPAEEQVREVIREVVTVVQDEAVLAQIDELRRFNEDLRSRMDQRENEYAEMLAAKDSEVQESQQMLNARFEEFNGRYEEVSELVRQRNDVIQQKDSELQQKESELTILRSQLDEMRDQTRDMVADLQRQLTSTQQAVEEAAKAKAAAPVPKAQTNFFEATGSTPPTPQPSTLFSEPAPQPSFNANPGAQLGLGAPAPQLPLPAPQPAPAPPPEPAPAPPPAPAATATQAELQPVNEPTGLAANLANNNNSISNQAIPRPQVSAPTTPMMGSGSYGSGVRAQVFEVIVRQALAGAPWREICAGPMQVNNISPDEVEAEVKRRQALLKK